MRFASLLHPFCQTTKSEDGFQAFQLLQLHYIWCGGRGEGAVKIIKRSRGGTGLILLLPRGGHYIIMSPLKLISQSLLLIIIAQSLTVVTKFLDLDRDGHLHCRTMEKKSMDYRFAPEYNRAQRLRRCQFFFRFLFSAIFAGSRFFEVQKFCYHGNVT